MAYMNGYTKLFGSIVASTIWRESKETKIVWITMLALANKDGIVEASLPGLADLSRVTIPELESALETLKAPDPYSRTKDNDGRRICECEGGWHILNHAKYRAKMGADERREYMRIKQQEQRDKKKAASTIVKTSTDKSTESTQSEAEADTKAESKAKKKIKATKEELVAYCLSLELTEQDGLWLFEKWEANGWKNGTSPIKDWKGTIRAWKLAGYMQSQKNGNRQSVIQPEIIPTESDPFNTAIADLKREFKDGMMLAKKAHYRVRVHLSKIEDNRFKELESIFTAEQWEWLCELRFSKQ